MPKNFFSPLLAAVLLASPAGAYYVPLDSARVRAIHVAANRQVRHNDHAKALALLTAASQYKRRDPADLEEAELIENTFGCLVLVLQQPENQHLFLKVRPLHGRYKQDRYTTVT